METTVPWLALVLGVPFSLLAAVSAYLITYNEYQHHYANARQARAPAFQAAAFAFAMFLSLSLIIAVLVPRVTA